MAIRVTSSIDNGFRTEGEIESKDLVVDQTQKQRINYWYITHFFIHTNNLVELLLHFLILKVFTVQPL